MHNSSKLIFFTKSIASLLSLIVKDASKLSALGYYAFEGKEREGGYRLSLREKRLIDEAKKQMGPDAVTTNVNKKLQTIGTAIEDEQERAALYSRQSLNDKGQLANTKDHRDWEAGFNKAYFKNLDNITKKEGA